MISLTLRAPFGAAIIIVGWVMIVLTNWGKLATECYLFTKAKTPQHTLTAAFNLHT